MLHVHDLLDEYEHRLVARWASAALHDGTGALDARAHERVASFLEELRSALSTAVSEEAPSLAPPGEEEHIASPAAGLDVLVATRGFGALHCLILELAAQRGVPVSPAEQLTLASHVNRAIAGAAELHLRQHDQDARRAAHQLRNPLGSAMMALTLLRSRVEFGTDARLVDTLERNLARIQGLIDEATPARKHGGSVEAPHAG